VKSNGQREGRLTAGGREETRDRRPVQWRRAGGTPPKQTNDPVKTKQRETQLTVAVADKHNRRSAWRAGLTRLARQLICKKGQWGGLEPRTGSEDRVESPMGKHEWWISKQPRASPLAGQHASSNSGEKKKGTSMTEQAQTNRGAGRGRTIVCPGGRQAEFIFRCRRLARQGISKPLWRRRKKGGVEEAKMAS